MRLLGPPFPRGVELGDDNNYILCDTAAPGCGQEYAVMKRDGLRTATMQVGRQYAPLPGTGQRQVRSRRGLSSGAPSSREARGRRLSTGRMGGVTDFFRNLQRVVGWVMHGPQAKSAQNLLSFGRVQILLEALERE